MQKLKCVFMGTPDFSVPTLEMLSHHAHIELVNVISMPDRKKGRRQKLQSPEVIEFAKENRIPFLQTENINKEEGFISSLQNVDIIVVLAFSQFLGSKILNATKTGCFNIHTSILPKYRGAAPIQYALLNGDTSTGISIQKMVKKMDAGDLVAFRNAVISDTETGGELYAKLKDEAALCMDQLIITICNDKIIYTPQDEASVSFAPTLKKEDGHLDFKNKTYEEVRNNIRALDPWPGTYCFLNGKRLKVFKISKDSQSLKPGEISTMFNTLAVGTKDISLRLTNIQLEGKKPCDDTQLLNGLQNNSQEILLTNSNGDKL